MVRTLACFCLVLSNSANAQFEVASVRPSPADRHSESTGMTTGKGRLTANELTLKRYIMGGYAVGNHQIAGGPEWLDSNRYDIVARAEKPVDDDAVIMGMLRTLLAERFKLTVHRETRTMCAYVLTVGKNGSKLEKSLEAGRAEARKLMLELREVKEAMKKKSEK